MVASEPWRTLGRSLEASLAVLQNPTKEVYVATSGAAVRGFLILDLTGPFPGYVQTVCVAPEARDRGLGSRLLAFAEARIFRESPNVFMCVSSFNHGARRLYARLGYEEVGVLRGYVVPEYDELLLRKSVGAWRDFGQAGGTARDGAPGAA
jgi:[ribosomal protein S18]-alanine N-acetyltransferase